MRLASLTAVVVIALFAARASAQESDEDRKAAAKLFGEGQKAYREGDFRHAAQAFEDAYQKAPRLPPLYNAARAWQKGGEMVRAANLYASYLRKAPPSAPDRNSATSALRDLETKLARLEVHAADFSDLKVDGAPVALEDQQPASLVIYVTPGSHVIEGMHAGAAARQEPTATAGTSMSVVLMPKETAVVAPVVVEKPRGGGGLSPIVVIVGAGATVLAGGFMIWSGVDTTSQRNTFNASPTQANLDTGRSDEARTNVLVGITAGLAVVTGVLAIFVDWKGTKKTEATSAKSTIRFVPGIGGGMLEGSF
jgi:hypothetical protein